jgi:ATP-binding cassette subfamily B multidrug efflux pump
MSTVAGKAFDYKLFKRVLAYIKPYKVKFYITAILTILLAILGPIKPKMIGDTIDKYVIPGDGEGMLRWIMMIVAVLFLEAILQFFQTYLANWLGQSVVIDIRVNLYRKITGFKLKYFDNTAIGTLVTRVISDIETIGDIFSQGLLIIIGDILKLTVVIVYMLYVDWKLALLCMASIPLLIIATNIFKNAIKKAFTSVRTQVSKLNAFVQEHVTGMSVVQIFNRQEAEMDKFVEINRAHRDAHIKTVWANSIFFPIVEIFSAISISLLVWYGVKGVISEEFTFGVLFEFILLIHMLFRPIRQLADRFNVLQMGMVGSERVFKIIDTQEQIEDTGSIEADFNGEISFKDVWFAYKEEDYVLKGVSFAMKQGETIAFVGATGAGKSSVINLLNRFYEYQKGEILIDGTDLRKFTLNSVRSNIAVVLQDVFLFSDTIFNNITLGNKDITREEVIHAAKLVGAHEFIMQLPGNYDYDVRERGGMLSTGQRQLLAFIRAYVYNPAILILDEATSSIDTESEQLIQRAIDVITKGRTSIVIAHRLSTIQKADKIMVMDQGHLIEQGSHFELLEQNGMYKELFDLQFKD